MPLSSVVGAQSIIKPGVCTSSTRPAVPFEGQMIYETDTDLVSAYNGSAWVYQSPLRFTPEAARDAAITAPTEGMIAYLTAPTVPAATGATTYVPTGIQTIYNGSSWVCVTGVGAKVTVNQTTTSTAYTDLATVGPAVTLSTGTTALVQLSALITASATSVYGIAAVAVSGASTIAGNDLESVFVQSPSGNYQGMAGRTIVIGGLTAGTNTFTMKYRVTAGTGTFEGRQLFVQGIA